MSLALYPDQDITTQLSPGHWSGIEKDWTNALDSYMLGQLNIDPGQLVDFVESYAHNARPSSSAELRQRVFTLLVLHPQLFRSPSPEFIYQLLTVFGGSNVSKLVKFIESRNALNLLTKKLAKVLIHHAATDMNQVESNLAVLFTSPQIAKLLATDKYWIDQSKKHTSLDILTHRAISVAHLREMFPDEPLKRIVQVLDQYISVQEASAYLLGHQADPEPQSKASTSTFKPIVFDAPEIRPDKIVIREDNYVHPSETSAEHTMRLVEIQMEEEEEDELDEVQRSEDPVSAKALDKVERHLWQVYQKHPDVFSNKQKKSKARAELKHATKWSDEQIEGWARILERNPRRKQFFASRFMFKGNKQDDRIDSLLLQNQQRSSNNSTPSGSGTNTPGLIAPRDSTPEDDRPRDNGFDTQDGSGSNSAKNETVGTPKHTPSNRKKNHHRKDRHDKKMQRMGAGPS